MVVKLDVQKLYNGLYWTNRYLLDLADPADVSEAMVTAVVNAEAHFHAIPVNLISARVSDDVEGTDNFIIYPLSANGDVTLVGNPLPGWWTLRADMGVGPGRPCRKYYRVYVGEDHVDGGIWQETYRADTEDVLNELIGLVPTLCDPQGNHWVNAVVKRDVQMRQLRRGTRKPLTPVIPIA